jgi:chemotaxis protein MotB
MQSQFDVVGEQLAGAQKSLEDERTRLNAELEDAFKAVDASKEKIEVQLKQLAALKQDVEALKALKAELAKELAQAKVSAQSGRSALAEEREISAAAKAQLALLNRQLTELRKQIATLNAALEASAKEDEAQKVKIADLGKKLNSALARKVQELSRYRSEFFGRLRVVLGNRKDIRVVGDRFVFQSEVLFDSGSAKLGREGKNQLARLAQTLRDIGARIPSEIKWVLRIDGHTDDVPISTDHFPTNWELSSARAISVVKYLISRNIRPNRLTAAGFGQYQPLVNGKDVASRRRNRRIEMKLDQR